MRLFGAAFLLTRIVTATTYDKTKELPSPQQLTQDEAITLLNQRQQTPRHSYVIEGSSVTGGIRK